MSTKVSVGEISNNYRFLFDIFVFSTQLCKLKLSLIPLITAIKGLCTGFAEHRAGILVWLSITNLSYQVLPEYVTSHSITPGRHWLCAVDEYLDTSRRCRRKPAGQVNENCRKNCMVAELDAKRAIFSNMYWLSWLHLKLQLSKIITHARFVKLQMTLRTSWIARLLVEV